MGQRIEIDESSADVTDIEFERGNDGKIRQIDYLHGPILLYSLIISRDMKGKVKAIRTQKTGKT